LGGATAWLPILADPLERKPRGVRPIPSANLPALVDAGFAHGVLPAMRRHLARLSNTLGPAALVAGPDPARHVAVAIAELDRRRVVLAGQSMLLAHHARRIAEAYASERLAASIVKGIVFSEKLYPNRPERTFTDIDVLLAPEAVEKAAEILRALGYVPATDEDEHDNDRGELKWLLPGNDLLLVELQTNLIHSANLRTGIRFGYVHLMEAGGGDPLDATAQLFVAAVHGAAGHQFERLQPAVDVLQAARGAAGAIDRARMVRVAKLTGSAAAIQAALDMVARLFDEPAARDLANALGFAPLRLARALLLPPSVMIRSQAEAGWKDSWRRRTLRELIRRAGRTAGAPEAAAE
jgi:hypothetical protein